MGIFNRILYLLLLVSVIVLIGLLLLLIWSDGPHQLLIKAISTSIVVLAACSIVMGANLQVLRIKSAACKKSEEPRQQG